MWTHLIEQFPQVCRRVRLALPCIGLDSLCMGLQEMKFDAFDIVYAYDTDGSLLPHLFSLHGPIGLGGPGIGLGRRGDILNVDVTAWERVDFVMSGPPCPPWSSIGLRRQSQDIRSKVFLQVPCCIKHQGHLGAYGFLIEMVVGMDSVPASNSGRQSYCAERLDDLERECPMFIIDT